MNLITLGINTINPKKFKEIKNRRARNKPFGGLWCSPEKCEYAWKDFVIGERYMTDHYLSEMILLTLKDSAMIYKIDNVLDFNNCLKEYSITGEDSAYFSGIIDNNCFIDFEKLSKDYDALWITVNALEEIEKISYENRVYLSPLYGWDVETVLLFNLNCIESYA